MVMMLMAMSLMATTSMDKTSMDMTSMDMTSMEQHGEAWRSMEQYRAAAEEEWSDRRLGRRVATQAGK